MMPKLTLISHKLCPYVQRAVIALTEKAVPFERRDVDLANKPEWFLRVSPLGKTPVLLVHVPQKWEPVLRKGHASAKTLTSRLRSPARRGSPGNSSRRAGSPAWRASSR